MNSHATVSSDSTGGTDQCQQNIDQSQRVQPSSSHANVRPITEAQTGHSKNQPIAAQSVSPLNHTAKIQTDRFETLSGKAPHPEYLKKGPIITRQMFDNWTPDIFADAGSSMSVRPVRRTRNQAPRYVDAMDLNTPEDLQLINGQLTRIK